MKLLWAISLTCLLLVSCTERNIAVSAPAPVVKAWVPCHGKSMLPTYPDKAMVEFEFGVPFADLKQGDAVIFWDYKRGATAITHHRLVAKQGGNWIARGDANDSADQSWVTPDNYLARGTGQWAYVISPQ